MADYTRQDSGAMRRDAQRRAQQMKQRVPFVRDSGDDGHEEYKYHTESHCNNEPESHESKHNARSGSTQQLPFGVDRLLSQLDSDRMLILAILAMLYKDGRNKKLMMALAYLLT